METLLFMITHLSQNGGQMKIVDMLHTEYWYLISLPRPLQFIIIRTPVFGAKMVDELYLCGETKNNYFC